jgi:hypothetical protein
VAVVDSERFTLRVLPEWLAAVDGVRGDASRARFIKRVVVAAVAGVASVPVASGVAPELEAKRRANVARQREASAPAVRGSPSSSLRNFMRPGADS